MQSIRPTRPHGLSLDARTWCMGPTTVPQRPALDRAGKRLRSGTIKRSRHAPPHPPPVVLARCPSRAPSNRCHGELSCTTSGSAYVNMGSALFAGAVISLVCSGDEGCCCRCCCCCCCSNCTCAAFAATDTAPPASAPAASVLHSVQGGSGAAMAWGRGRLQPRDLTV